MMRTRILTLNDTNGCTGEVKVWYTESIDRGSYDTPACHEINVERYALLTTEDFTPELWQIEQALEDEILN